jgi:2-polyprenyl-3-methyl-5-hydroxy-6-metoxy-1,4-benzoquinol methylase
MVAKPERWNHNIHYHPLILAAVPAGCARALDVGCGEGVLARELSRLSTRVVAIDRDQQSIALARRRGASTEAEAEAEAEAEESIEYVCGDFLDYGLEPASFDFVASVATLHHMDAAAGLDRMRQLLRPGGTLAVVGCARSDLPADLPFEAAGALAHRLLVRTRTYWQHSAPGVWPPPETYAAMRRIARRELPGVRYRRHALWRYSLTWTKPT